MIQPTILLSPAKPAIPTSGGTLDVMVRVQAPDQPTNSQRKATPKRLALVVDRSGSMDGQPLTEALKCVLHIANRMTPADQIAVVVYDDKVDTLVPLTPMVSADAVRQATAHVESGGSTNLFAGWKEGAVQLEGGIPQSISRVLLLSDGQANSGITDVDLIQKHCEKWLSKGVSTTTVGLGRSFNEDLMIAMARAGGGLQYYGQTAADLYDSFDEEFSLLQALCLRNLQVKLVPAAGVIIEPVGLVQQAADGSYGLSDLAWGSEAWMVLRLHISPGAVGDTRDLLAVTLNAQTLEGRAITAQANMLRLPAVEQSSFNALAIDEMVERRVQELEFAKTSQTLNRLVQQGDTQAARAMMDDMEHRFGRHPWLRDKLSRLRILAEQDTVMMSKEIRFSSRKMSSRLASKTEVAYSIDETNSAMPAFLRKKAEEGKGRKSSQ